MIDKVFTGALCLFAIITSAIETAMPPMHYGNTRPPRCIQIGKQEWMNLAMGAENLEIVVQTKQGLITGFAAKELKTFLEKRLKTAIPIVETPTPGKISFMLGISEYSREANIDDGKLCRDAFIIRTEKNRIYILGKDDRKDFWSLYQQHGTLFGVYDFLERFAGIRFYYRDDRFIFIPENKPLQIPEINIFDRPDFEDRQWDPHAGWWDKENSGQEKRTFFSANRKWSKEKLLTAFQNRHQTRNVPNNHGVALLEHLRRFGKTHPEYFALKADGTRYLSTGEFAGQLCFHSGIMEEIYKDAVAVLTNQPPSSRGVSRWAFWGHTPGAVFGHHYQDGLYPCHCEKCQEWFMKGEKGVTELIWRTVADTASRLKKNGIKGQVSMLAYANYKKVPDVKLPDNVTVMLALRGPWSENEGLELAKQWTEKLNCKIWLWNYPCKIMKLDLPGISCSTPRAIGRYYKKFAPYIWGAFMESHVDRTSYQFMNYYVFGKVAWDNSADVDALLKEYYSLMYGAGAEPVQKIFDRMEELWMTRIGGKYVETDIGPVPATASENEIWTRIYSPEELKSLSALFEQAKKLTAGDQDIQARLAFIQQEFLAPLKENSAAYFQRNNTLEAFGTEITRSTGKHTVQIDGKATEAFWKESVLLKLQKHHWKSRNKPENSLVRLGMDKDNLYVFCDFSESAMSKVNAPPRKNDSDVLWEDNCIEFMIDPTGERKDYYYFTVTSAGFYSDAYAIKLGANSRMDYQWNSGMKAAVSHQPDSWSAEIAIPLKSMKPFGEKGFTANFTRNQSVGNESRLYSWSPFIRKNFQESDNFGRIRFACGSENLIRDPSFEVPVSPHQRFGAWSSLWNLPEGAVVTLDEMEFFHGTRSLKLSTNKPVKLFQTAQKLPKLKANTRYRISCCVKTENVKSAGSIGGACINIWDDKNVFFPSNHRWITGTNDWFVISGEFVSGPKTNIHPVKSYIMLWLQNATGTVWFDQLRLEEIQ